MRYFKIISKRKAKRIVEKNRNHEICEVFTLLRSILSHSHRGHCADKLCEHKDTIRLMDSVNYLGYDTEKYLYIKKEKRDMIYGTDILHFTGTLVLDRSGIEWKYI